MLKQVRGPLRRRLAAVALSAIALAASGIGPAAAAPPHRVIFSLDGLSAGTTFVHWERVGDLDRATVITLSFGRHRNNYYGEQPEHSELVAVNVQTYWLPVDRESDDEIVAFAEEIGQVETSGRVDIDLLRLTYAKLPPTDVVLDLLTCTARPGSEQLCAERRPRRTVEVAADLTAVGELMTDRYRSHDHVFVCDLLEVGSHASRDAEGTVWADGIGYSRLIPWLTYIAEGWTFVRLLCDA